jgi:hypothetical protein
MGIDDIYSLIILWIYRGKPDRKIFGLVIDYFGFFGIQERLAETGQEKGFKDRCFAGAVETINQVFVFIEYDLEILEVPEPDDLKVFYNQKFTFKA